MDLHCWWRRRKLRRKKRAVASQLLASSVLSVSYSSCCFWMPPFSRADTVARCKLCRISSVSMMTTGVAPSVSWDLLF